MKKIILALMAIFVILRHKPFNFRQNEENYLSFDGNSGTWCL